MRRKHESKLKPLLRKLPKPVACQLVRSLVRFDLAIDPTIEFKMATTITETEQALRLVHDEYVKSGYIEPQPNGIWVIPHHQRNSTAILIAKKDQQVIATLTVARNDRCALPLEKVFDISAFSDRTRRCTEVTCLTIHPDHRRRAKGSTLLYLMKYMYLFCTHHFGTEDLYVTVLPKDAIFYESLLLFNASEFGVRDYMGAPAVLLRLDLTTAPERYRKAYRSILAAQDLFEFFVLRPESNFLFPTRIWSEICYQPPARGVICADTLDHSRNTAGSESNAAKGPQELSRAMRFQVSAKAVLFSALSTKVTGVEIRDVSARGLKIKLLSQDPHMSAGKELILSWRTPSGDKDHIQVRVQWLDPSQKIAGLEIIEKTLAWERIQKALQDTLQVENEKAKPAA